MTYLLDWAGLLVRWLHVIAGIAWIGASFYFVWLDNHLQPVLQSDADSGIAGELWAVHGGGFYRSQKYRVAPDRLPPTLHWFYWEAYTTWLSGFTLLVVVYFVRADAYLIDPSVAPLSKPVAITMALAVLAGSWLAYDMLCRSPLGRRPTALTTSLALAIAVEAWLLCHFFSGRGAFMLFGCALGTIMVANVFFVIIPGQRELVSAKMEGRVPDAAPGLRGKQRSVHNTYFTLPVVFAMISNHYAMTYGARGNWAILISMSLAGASIRAWFVARHKPVRARFGGAGPLILAAFLLAAVILAQSPVLQPARVGRAQPAGKVLAVLAQRIVDDRCVPCHAWSPRQAGFSAPPNGLVFQRMDQVLAHAPEIRTQLVTRAMPLGNLTRMTDEERSTLLAWIDEAALP